MGGRKETMGKFTLWFKALGWIGQALTMVEDGENTMEEAQSLITSILTGIGVDMDFTKFSIVFNEEGDLVVTLKKELFGDLKLKIDV